MKAAADMVVITGIGPVTAIGTGKDNFWKNLLDGVTVLRPVPPAFDKNYHFKSGYYVPFPEVSLVEHQLPAKYEVLMEPSTRAAVVAAGLAMEDAGLNPHALMHDPPFEPSRCMVMLGTGVCSLKAGFDAHEAHALNPEKRYNRMVIPMIMPDSATSWVSILFGLTGGNFTINASCASGTVAIGEAYRKIMDGSADMVLAGGVECLQDETGTIMRGFDGLGTLTTSSDGLPRPFSSDRSGFLFSEGGACVMVLESLDHALKRGIRPYAAIMDYACNSDAYNIVQMEPGGRMALGLVKKLVNGRKIDYINTHGTGTHLNDETEALIIKTLFGENHSQPFINSTKGILGHSIGVSGAIEAAVTALSVSNHVIHKNITDNPMPGLNLVMENTPCDINLAVSASYGFGGHNAALLIGKV